MDKVKLEGIMYCAYRDLDELILDQFNKNNLEVKEIYDDLCYKVYHVGGVELDIEESTINEDTCIEDLKISINVLFLNKENQENSRFYKDCDGFKIFGSRTIGTPFFYENINRLSKSQKRVLDIIGSIFGMIKTENNDAILFNTINIDSIPKKEHFNNGIKRTIKYL